MTVQELRNVLAEMSDTAEVILSKDAEGNHFSPLYSVSMQSIYIPENSYSGTVYDAAWSADEAGMDETTWQEILQGPRVLVLWPTN